MKEVLLDLRRELHQYPELSGAESRTADRIIEFANTHNPPSIIINEIGGHSLALVYDYDQLGPCVMLRCELDALPIQEVNQFSYKSKVEGVSHKCGHDGHMTMLCGVILKLKERDFRYGRIILFFQSAEETGQGAKQALTDHRFQTLNPDYVFALHNIPGLPMDQVIVQPDQFSPSVISMRAELKGQVAHASSPDTGTNPALAIAAVIKNLNELNNLETSCPEFSLLTPVCIEMGEPAYGISAGSGSVHYTIRAWSDMLLKALQKRIEDNFSSISEDYQLQLDVAWFEYFPATVNDPTANDLLRTSIEDLNYDVVEAEEPFRFGEDFGWFSQKWPCAMFGLGAGVNTPALHDEAYDFPDELIDTGSTVFSQIIATVLTSR